MTATRRLLAEIEPGRFELIEVEDIFFVRAERDDSLIRTRRKKPRRSVEELGEIAERLDSPAFFRCHRSTVVNLDRVREIRRRKDGAGWELKLDPPVNAVLPVARNRAAALFRLLGRRGD